MEDHYLGLCPLVDGFYRRLEFDSCLTRLESLGESWNHAHSVAVSSDAFKRYVEENVAVFTLHRRSDQPRQEEPDTSADAEASAELGASADAEALVDTEAPAEL